MGEPLLNGRGVSPEDIRNLCRRYDRELSLVKDWMFWFLLLWTGILLVMEWREFLGGAGVPASMTAAYTILLGSYIAHKEVLRWTGVEAKMRRGELFVYIWWGMLLAMYLLTYTFGTFDVRDEMILLSYKVLGLFVFGEASKAYNGWHVERQAKRRIEGIVDANDRG